MVDLSDRTVEQSLYRFLDFKQRFLSVETDSTRLYHDCEPTERSTQIFDYWLFKQYMIFEQEHRGHITSEQAHRKIVNSVQALGKCAHCSNLGNLRCGKCKQVHYCGRECQRQHWAAHKQECAGCERERKD